MVNLVCKNFSLDFFGLIYEGFPPKGRKQMFLIKQQWVEGFHLPVYHDNGTFHFHHDVLLGGRTNLEGTANTPAAAPLYDPAWVNPPERRRRA